MTEYKIWVVYDKDGQEGISEEILVRAESLEKAIAKLNDLSSYEAQHLPKTYEIHKKATVDGNDLTAEDLAYLDTLDYAY